MLKETQTFRPNFLIAGAAKCGTTSLYHYLRQHPEVFMSDPKEPRFFAGFGGKKGVGPGDQYVIDAAVKTWEDYLALFAKAKGKKAIGEASVSTLFHSECSIPAIQRHLGDPRIIIILRDPVDSVYSTYNYLIRIGRESMSFEEALRLEDERKRLGYGCIWRYRESRIYAPKIKAFQDAFSRVLILFYDDLKSDPAGLFRSMCTFLQIDPAFTPKAWGVHNVSGVPKIGWVNRLFHKPKRLHKIARSLGAALIGETRWVAMRERLMRMNLDQPDLMPPGIARELRAYFRDDILELQKITGRDLSEWLKERKDKKSANFSTG